MSKEALIFKHWTRNDIHFDGVKDAMDELLQPFISLLKSFIAHYEAQAAQEPNPTSYESEDIRQAKELVKQYGNEYSNETL